MKVTDVEQVKKQVRKLAAGRVLAGEAAEVGIELAGLDGCRACIQAGYGQISKGVDATTHDRFVWILDGLVEVYDATGHIGTVSQGEGTILSGRTPYRLVFPHLTLYLSVEPT
ncbi:MAG: hypothetical protein JXA93_10575 [Anaerolineae bacterium]|nr:hypothetical protein [Anaerolineae bacterium]